MLILNQIHRKFNIQLEQVHFEIVLLWYFRFQLVETTRRRKKSTDNNNTSSDDDKINPPVEISPFTFDSLQKLAQQNDANNNQTLIQLDHLYPSIEKINQMKQIDEDDDLLLAAATACTNIKTK